MKILQFAFSTDSTDKFLPHNYARNFIVYTGTHDNDTSWGWYKNTATAHERDHFRRYFRTDGHDAAWTLIGTAWSSVAVNALAPLQDFLNLGGETRMNLPGRADGNWTWRFTADQISAQLGARVKEMTQLYGRDPLMFEGKSAEAGGQEGKTDKGAGGGA